MIRYALVKNARSRSEAEAYLPDNYKIIFEGIEQTRKFNCVAPGGTSVDDEKIVFVIAGEDKAGWGLDTYVKPRYASGLIWAEEIDLSHPIMKEVPLDA